MLHVYGDADAMRYVADGTTLGSAECSKWLTVTQSNYARRGYGMFALVCRATGAVVGFCGLVHPSDQATPELKYALAREFWGRGLATEGAAALLAEAGTFGLNRVIATVAPDNLASQRVLVKAGMRLELVRQDADGFDVHVFGWSASNAALGAASGP